jgi:phage gp36-like protein
MSYATQTDLVDRYGEQELIELTDVLNAPPAAIDTAVVADKLADAEAEINTWICARYTTPVSPVPRVLTNKACAIARYYLWKDRASERVKSDYAEAIAWLQKVSQGQASLGDNVNPATQSNTGAPQVSAPPRLFTRDSMKDL